MCLAKFKSIIFTKRLPNTFLNIENFRTFMIHFTISSNCTHRNYWIVLSCLGPIFVRRFQASLKLSVLKYLVFALSRWLCLRLKYLNLFEIQRAYPCFLLSILSVVHEYLLVIVICPIDSLLVTNFLMSMPSESGTSCIRNWCGADRRTIQNYVNKNVVQPLNFSIILWVQHLRKVYAY